MINDYEDIGTSGNYLKGVLGDVLQPDSGKKILK